MRPIRIHGGGNTAGSRIEALFNGEILHQLLVHAVQIGGGSSSQHVPEFR